MPSGDKLYGSGAWRRMRQTVLDRDGWRCVVRGPRCTRVATEVDHIVPLSAGGARLDPDNLRASCAKCNRGRFMRDLERLKAAGDTHTSAAGPSRDW